ncbi:Putative O-methyltransferase domain, S-adenosyl-L-methionine-dependent methyltransferase [Septoria linicola]|uniref:O-methyltransferase domain, S-adenosyl-L-methionine-dependent methyltransferase n=1 Tax=Septoria linicola TaxID=215465 RepID=A0A9Q9AU08_9PEZI|nr:Putative O-methyltransferase domain, S-adenosyl-L-methionine-dependent methyltransferase [Septoria linicola]
MNGHTRHKSDAGIEANQVLWQLRSLRKRLPALLDASGDEKLRDDLLYELRYLGQDLETPWHTLQRTCWYGPWDNVTIDIAVNMGLFKALVAADEPLSASTLATKCNAELLFTQRLLRCLNAFGSVKQHWPDGSAEPLFGPTNVTKTFTSKMGEATSHWLTEMMSPAWYLMPQKLKETGYKSMTSGTDTIFNDIHGMPGKSLWEIVGQGPYVEDVGTFMTMFNMNHKPWTDLYDFNSRLIKGAHQDGVFMVDVGGFTGSVVSGLRKQFPEAPGKFVLLDLPTAVPASLFSGITPCPHDFFKAFPTEVHGARLYYMRFISHDWSQDALIKILSNIRAAMTPGYSKLVINDWIVPERDPHPFMCSQDLCMMHLGGGEERSEARHREAIEAAGLKVSAIFRAEDRVSEDVIECEVETGRTDSVVV